jgi:nitrite reductase/ring-hydroxylating ferredoxin subunit
LYELFDIAKMREPDARSVEVLTPAGEDVDVVVVKWQGEVYVYRNACPHTGVNLNWLPDQFWSEDGTLLQCSLHGAQFRPHDGTCVWGPCLGQALQALPFVIQDGVIFWDHG